MKQCLVPAKEDEASPHLPAGEQGAASSRCRKTRCRLTLTQEDEAPPRLSVRVSDLRGGLETFPALQNMKKMERL
ncbi:hypothetical protein GW17_00036003 [Ensete ventricosum]|nr:hypothetical protein GW17_00036003 [Ensete ventricosum]